MIVYNVTVKLELSIAESWLNWMRKEHIPEVLATCMFVSYRMLRILSDEEEEDGVTYAIQYTCPTKAKFQEYLTSHAAGLQQKHKDLYNNKYIAIRTLMHVVEEKVLFSSDS